MRKLLGFIGILAFVLCNSNTRADSSTNSPAVPKPSLAIAPSSTSVTGGTVTLTIGELTFKSGFYVGEYKVKVSPYFFRNEEGKLSMAAPEESLRKLTNGIALNFTGDAIDRKGRIKKINGTLTPSKNNHGNVCLWFMSGKTKMTFNTTYRCVEK